MKKFILLVSAVCFSLSFSFAQNVRVPVLENDEPMKTGRYEPNWESLSKHETPEWFRNAKFGVWAHWGPQCVEGSGDWMAKLLYQEGSSQYRYHCEHYGHPSEVGFKDVLPEFKAENWDPVKLLMFYKEIGAQYFCALGNHHDNYDLWDSKYQEWNSMNIGSHRDILAEWAAAAHEVGLPFGISFHADHAWTWYEVSRGADKTGDKAGVKYDGWLTKEDGAGKWWEGYDPQNLYAQDHPFSHVSKKGLWNWEEGVCLPSVEYATNFYNRTLDAINRYHPDLIYFDDTVMPLYPVSDAGFKIAAHFYNTNANGVMLGKVLDENQRKALTWDVERGAPNEIIPEAWQCCNCIGNWHYKTSVYENNEYKSAAVVAKLLVDIVSKNGNMLLSVPLRADGTFDEKEEAILREFGAWMKINSESIVGTRPWLIFGEGPIADSKIVVKAQGFNDSSYIGATSEEIRYTQTDNYLYATPLAWPDNRVVTIKSLAKGSELFNKKIRKVELLGYGKVKFKRSADALVINLPDEQMNNIMPVFRFKK